MIYKKSAKYKIQLLLIHTRVYIEYIFSAGGFSVLNSKIKTANLEACKLQLGTLHDVFLSSSSSL